MVLRTTKGCGLGVSRYPDFVYNAEGGGGSGKAEQLEDGRWRVEFNAAEVNIPDVGYRTTTLLGIPLPPPIRIQIVPDSLEGIVDRNTGKVNHPAPHAYYPSFPPVHYDLSVMTQTTVCQS